MKPTLQKPLVAIALMLAGGITGGLIVLAAAPYLRQVDPLGIFPVVLISVMGGFALGWYLRGRVEPGTALDPVRINDSGNS
jgi:hypothetical protein